MVETPKEGLSSYVIESKLVNIPFNSLKTVYYPFSTRIVGFFIFRINVLYFLQAQKPHWFVIHKSLIEKCHPPNVLCSVLCSIKDD